MSNKKYREFWVFKDSNAYGEVGDYAAKGGVKLEPIHVIEHSAYESLQKRVAELEAEIADYWEALEFYGQNEGLRINHVTNAFESCDSDDKDFHGAKAREVLNKYQKPKSEG
jgi:hypothetical protein